MKPIALLTIVTLGGFVVGASSAQGLPDLTCQTLEEVTITHIDTLPARNSTKPDLYRLAGGKLYMSSPGRDEYLYSDVAVVEPGRFTAGYKTFVFSIGDYESMVEVHTDSQGTRVRRLHCVRTG